MLDPGSRPSLALLACVACLACASPRDAEPARASGPASPASSATSETASGLLGPLAADVRSTSAWLWARAPAPGEVAFALLSPEPRELGSVPASRASDQTAALRVTGLEPSTSYTYEVRHGAHLRSGRFRTAPASAVPAAVRVAFGGDLAGQNVCRDAVRGFPIFRAVSDRRPDLFIGLGDMIYADDVCRATGRYGNPQVPGRFEASGELADLRAHWRYAREDAAFAELLASVPYAAVWDDHEVRNDFGADDPLLPAGLRVFREYNPVDVGRADSDRLYRSLRLGRHLELFLLDTRQHRDANTRPDSSDKSLLGRPQHDWLVAGLRGSDATWKVIVSSVPLSVPTGADDTRRDGWAGYRGETGFESELASLLGSLAPERIASLVWITTDVHFAQVIRYAPLRARLDVHMHEAMVGPLQAGLFPKRELDDTLRPEVLFFHGPESADGVEGFDEALRWFNFGELEVDAAGHLTLRVRGVDGAELHAESLEPSP